MKRLLVALDASPRAPLVLATADRLAELVGARMIVFRAVTVPPDMPRDVLALSDLSLDGREAIASGILSNGCRPRPTICQVRRH